LFGRVFFTQTEISSLESGSTIPLALGVVFLSTASQSQGSGIRRERSPNPFPSSAVIIL
jgi:hypothetical protein